MFYTRYMRTKGTTSKGYCRVCGEKLLVPSWVMCNKPECDARHVGRYGKTNKPKKYGKNTIYGHAVYNGVDVVLYDDVQ